MHKKGASIPGSFWSSFIYSRSSDFCLNIKVWSSVRLFPHLFSGNQTCIDVKGFATSNKGKMACWDYTARFNPGMSGRIRPWQLTMDSFIFFLIYLFPYWCPAELAYSYSRPCMKSTHEDRDIFTFYLTKHNLHWQ